MANKPEKNVTSFTICGVQGCCPVVEVHHDSDTVIISDDFGGKVTLTKQQWQEATTKVKLDA